MEISQVVSNEYYEYISTGIYPLKGVTPSVDMDNEEGNRIKMI